MRPQSDSLQVELLRLATTVLKHSPDLFSPKRRRLLVAHAWQLLKKDNAAVTSQAYLLIAHYMQRFPLAHDVAMKVSVFVDTAIITSTYALPFIIHACVSVCLYTGVWLHAALPAARRKEISAERGDGHCASKTA